MALNRFFLRQAPRKAQNNLPDRMRDELVDTKGREMICVLRG